MKALAEQYAKLKRTKVIAAKVNGDSITFVLESGPKLIMNAEQLEAEIETMQKANAIEQAVEDIRTQGIETETERKARLKAEAKAQARAKADAKKA